jgi:uncharacterized C2H2 Zn-finger protein
LIAGEPFRCEPCERIFPSRRAMLTHQKMQHDPELRLPQSSEYQPWTCGGCQKGFRTISSLQRHLRLGVCGVEPLSEPASLSTPRCPGCGRTFETTRGFSRHLRSGQRSCQAQAVSTAAAIQISVSLRNFAARHAWICCWCGGKVREDVNIFHSKGPTREHWIPRSRGGSNHAFNLRLAHKLCNHIRGNRDAEEYLAWIQNQGGRP